jgi:hypothetical protein
VAIIFFSKLLAQVKALDTADHGNIVEMRQRLRKLFEACVELLSGGEDRFSKKLEAYFAE